MKYMGIDYGRKNIGIAFSDEGGTLAFPSEVVKNDKNAFSHIVLIATEAKVGGVVMGHSVNYDGKDNLVMKEVRVISEKLGKDIGVPIHFEMETLTTALAKRQGTEGDARGTLANKRKAKKIRSMDHRDASAAALILQGFLDKNSKE